MPFTRAVLLTAIASGVLLQAPAATAGGFTRLEFMWEKPQAGTGAWSQALALTMAPDRPHRACVRAFEPGWLEADLRIEAIDAGGTRVVIDEYRQTRARSDGKPATPLLVACRDLPRPAATLQPGMWTFELFVDDLLVTSTDIRVVSDVSQESLGTDATAAYVQGRVNPSKEALAAPEPQGLLEWEMTVNPEGNVVHAAILRAEGVGDLLKERGLYAAYLTKFPRVSSPSGASRTVRQVYRFSF